MSCRFSKNYIFGILKRVSFLTFLLVSYSLQAQTPIGSDQGTYNKSYQWEEVRLTTIPLIEEVVGILRPTTVTTLSSKVLGNVVEVLKREGEMVSAGELLVRIDSKEIGSDLQGAQASLAEAQAALAEIKSQIETAKAAKESAESELKLAEVSFNRIKELFEKKSVTKQEYDQANTRLSQARSQVAQATAQIAALQARMAQISAKNEQAKAGISKVSTIKELTEVRAPFTGRVVARKVEPGALAAPGVPLMVLEDIGKIRFEAIVPERLIGYITEGSTMTVKVDALQGAEFNGNVVEIVPAADPMSLTFTVKVALENDLRLRSGMYARGFITKGTEQVILVPENAVQKRGQLEIVLVRLGEKAVHRLVKTGRKINGKIEILSGISPGEYVAVTDEVSK